MSTNDRQTFECTICKQHHNTVPDLLPTGHSGHKPHCLFCLAHTLYRIIIPAAPVPRPTPEQAEKNNIIKTRKIVLCTITPVVVLAYFAFRWQARLWHHIATGVGEGVERWHDRALWVMLCMVVLSPCGFVMGFVGAGGYYMYWCVKKKRAKRRKAIGTTTGLHAVRLQDRPLADLRYQDLREMNEPIKIVITPPESPPLRANRMSQMLGVVSDVFRSGYDGRAVRRESFAMEELGETQEEDRDAGSRPTTEWPVM
ncbi:uncharacterized protein N0V89_004458 [Didymosphaeria variabile]|uniref:Uncharacterized protein n=1 Tax=Didymosphaeria variabile TaxID=1932322 RepID=A0A9W9CD84_9PLEO|nr:uncharacterized protein N0V89_004458 [Didymosphaeria variabile]KAJ4356425.1 hypothetical protein N0V89_004458 [Didymosphaeria variabile]